MILFCLVCLPLFCLFGKALLSSPCRSLGWLLQVPAAAAAAAPLGAPAADLNFFGNTLSTFLLPAAEGWDAPGTCSPARQQGFSFREVLILRKLFKDYMRRSFIPTST